MFKMSKITGIGPCLPQCSKPSSLNSGSAPEPLGQDHLLSVVVDRELYQRSHDVQNMFSW